MRISTTLPPSPTHFSFAQLWWLAGFLNNRMDFYTSFKEVVLQLDFSIWLAHCALLRGAPGRGHEDHFDVQQAAQPQQQIRHGGGQESRPQGAQLASHKGKFL